MNNFESSLFSSLQTTQVSLECAKSNGRPGFVLKAYFRDQKTASPNASPTPQQLNEFVFATENFKTQNLWWKALQQHLLDQGEGGSLCTKKDISKLQQSFFFYKKKVMFFYDLYSTSLKLADLCIADLCIVFVNERWNSKPNTSISIVALF